MLRSYRVQADIPNLIQSNGKYLALQDLIFVIRNKTSLSEKYFIEKNGTFNKSSDYAVILHLYFTDNWQFIFSKKLILLSEKLNFDLYITMPESNKLFSATIRQDFKESNIMIVPNKGRDVLPFVKTANMLDSMGYKKVLKIHSKKSTHRDRAGNSAESGNDWLSRTLDALIPAEKGSLEKIIEKLKEPNTGMIGPLEYLYPLRMYLTSNLTLLRRLTSLYDPHFFDQGVSTKIDKLGFFGGTMFWADLASLREGLKISKSNFPKEIGQTDGTMAHALERFFCVLPQLKGMNLYGISTSKMEIIGVGKASYPEWYFDDISEGKPRISIVVPVYSDWWSLSKNVKSLVKYASNSEDVLVHYVNDCGPEADDLEEKILQSTGSLTNFYYHRNGKNLGFVKTCNRAAYELVGSQDDVLLLNSDTKVTENFFRIMKTQLYSQDNIGAVTARSNNATIWSVPMTARLANHRTMSYIMHKLIRNELPEKYITPTVHGFCVLIRRSVIKKYKLFDEAYGRGYGEENDFAMRIRQQGWKCAVANKVFIFHYESRSFGSAERTKLIEHNEKFLLKRYPTYRTLIQEYWDSISEPLK